MLFGGESWGTMEFMIMDYEEQASRQEKLDYIVKTIKESDDMVGINGICYKLGITLTTDEFNWILEQVNED